jgi:hypothetical protein
MISVPIAGIFVYVLTDREGKLISVLHSNCLLGKTFKLHIQKLQVIDGEYAGMTKDSNLTIFQEAAELFTNVFLCTEVVPVNAPDHSQN